MKFRPRFHRIKATTRSDVRLMATAKVDTLTTLQIMRMEKDLHITVALIKSLNPRMCFKIIAWVEAEESPQ